MQDNKRNKSKVQDMGFALWPIGVATSLIVLLASIFSAFMSNFAFIGGATDAQARLMSIFSYAMGIESIVSILMFSENRKHRTKVLATLFFVNLAFVAMIFRG